MTNYGYGWECENSEYTRADARRSLKEYRENCGGAVRLEKHREPVEGYEEKPQLILSLLAPGFVVLMVLKRCTFTILAAVYGVLASVMV